MSFVGITSKSGRIIFTSFLLLCLLWSFRYYDTFALTYRPASLTPSSQDVPGYSKIEDLTAAAEAHNPRKSTKSWFFGATGNNAVVESEEWFRLWPAKAAALVESSTSTKAARTTSLQPSSTDAMNLHPGSDGGSLEEYIAPANVSTGQTTMMTEATPSETTKGATSGLFERPYVATTASSPRSTPLILYAYSPASWALPNLQFFLRHALHNSATFIFIINGALISTTDASQPSPVITNSTEAGILEVLSVLEPYVEKYENIKIWKRPNTCYDLGAYAEVLKADASALVERHQKFIVMNASLRGPFVPFWSQECWSDAYVRLINTTSPTTSAGAGPVKLVGMTINCVSNRPRHIQSMILATDRVGIDILRGRGAGGGTPEASKGDNTTAIKYTNIGIDSCPTSMDEAVNIEVSLTPLIQSHNYTVRAMMAEYWSKPDYESDCTNGDINAGKGAYEGGDLGVFETLFIKTRWGVEAEQTERISQWYNGAIENGMIGGAWDRC